MSSRPTAMMPSSMRGHILNSGIVEDAAFCEWAGLMLKTAGNGASHAE